MKRRDFLKYSTALTAVPLILNRQIIHALPRNFFLEGLTSLRPDRKLVLIQLNGGNDGLATFVPLDQFANLYRARTNIIVPEDKLVSLTDTIGLHPSFGNIRSLYDEEKMLLIQGMGYPQPNLSHFRSKDIITSGSASDEIIHSGWMGRMLNNIHPLYPEGYPSESNPHPIALTIGSTSSPTCQGMATNMGAVIKNLSTSYTNGGSEIEYPDTPFGKEMEYISGMMQKTEAYLESIALVADNSRNLSTRYPASGNSLADQLKIVARLIAGGLQTQVYVVSLGGWDTHSGQTEDTIPEGGKHKNLLSKLSDALLAFQDDLNLLGIEDDVLGFVFTEFGRRIKSNSSFGTDHGTAWPAILFGSQVNPTIMGTNPVIPAVVEKGDNLPMQYDFRSLYASIFKHWFEAADEDIREVLYEDFDLLPILKEEEIIDNVKDLQIDELKIYPNPTRGMIYLEGLVALDKISIEVYTSTGSRLPVKANRVSHQAAKQTEIDLSDFPAGHYHVVIRNGSRANSTLVVKQ